MAWSTDLIDVSEFQKIKITEKDKDRANQLVRALVSVKRLKRNINFKQWPFHFHSLLRKLDSDHKRLQCTLDWYCENIGKEYTPIIHSVKSFEREFKRIEKHAKRNTVEKIVLCKSEKQLLRHVRNCIWPKDFEKHLPRVVHVSYQNAKALGKKLYEIKPVGLQHYIFDNHFFGPNCFTQHWIDAEFERVIEWDNWSGDPNSIIFSVNALRFQRMFGDWLSGYFGNNTSRKRKAFAAIQ